MLFNKFNLVKLLAKQFQLPEFSDLFSTKTFGFSKTFVLNLLMNHICFYMQAPASTVPATPAVPAPAPTQAQPSPMTS